MRAIWFLLRVVGLAIAFFVTFMIATALAGVANSAGARAAPADVGAVLRQFFLFSFLVALVIAWLVQRCAWSGARLMAALALIIYVLMTVVTQIESLVYLRQKMPVALIGRLFLAGLIQVLMFAPLAAVIMGRARASIGAPSSRTEGVGWRITLIAVVYVCLYYLFGYYVAWQNPELRQFYAGTTELKSFFGQLSTTWSTTPYVLPLQFVRGLLWALCGLLAVRMVAASRMTRAAIVAALFGVWSFVLLAPNPMLPSSVARSHFWETLLCDLLLGGIAGYVLSGRDAGSSVAAGVGS